MEHGFSLNTWDFHYTIYVNFCEGGNGPEMRRKAMSWLTPWDNDSELR